MELSGFHEYELGNFFFALSSWMTCWLDDDLMTTWWRLDFTYIDNHACDLFVYVIIKRNYLYIRRNTTTKYHIFCAIVNCFDCCPSFRFKVYLQYMPMLKVSAPNGFSMQSIHGFRDYKLCRRDFTRVSSVTFVSRLIAMGGWQVDTYPQQKVFHVWNTNTMRQDGNVTPYCI